MGIKQFLSSKAFAVVGVSSHRDKWGNKIVRCLLRHGKTVYPVHPYETNVEGQHCISKISELPNDVKSISIATPSSITEQIVEQAIQKSIQNIWIQPGSESDIAILNCMRHQVNIIANGPCILNVLHCKER